MGTVEKRGKASWRIATQVKVGDRWEWVRTTLHMDPALPDSVQKREAERELKRMEKRLAGEVADDDITLRAWSEQWLTKHIGVDVSPVTLSNYRYLLNSRILPQLGDYHLAELSPVILSDWLYRLRQAPRKTTRISDEQLSRPRRRGEKLIPPSKLAKPLSAKTAQHYHQCMKTMLAAAVRLGLLDSNPMDRVQRPKARKKQITALPEDQITDLIRLILDEAPQPLKLSVLLALSCGLRLGEVCALKHSDVDRMEGLLTVSAALKYTPADGAFLAAPKTAAGERVITLPASMTRILSDAFWTDVMEEQDDPDTWKGDGWIVHGPHGAPLNKDTPSKMFRRFADAHGYKGLTFHDLRHAHASLLVAHHVDVAAIAARMGHSDPSVTLSVYTHALPDHDQTAADELDQLLVASGAPAPDA